MRVALVLVIGCVAASASANTASTANAKARVVVLDFEGPHALADRARHVVQGVLARRYEIVATSAWQTAKRAAHEEDGPARWRHAATASHTDIVVEGWIDPSGRRKPITLAVRDARTGCQVDTVSVRLTVAGELSDDDTRDLNDQLDEMVDFDLADALWTTPDCHFASRGI